VVIRCTAWDDDTGCHDFLAASRRLTLAARLGLRRDLLAAYDSARAYADGVIVKMLLT
jgi:hypothetical protein